MALSGNPKDWSATTKHGAIWRQLQPLPHAERNCVECDRLWRHLIDTNQLGAAPFTFMSGGRMLPMGKERSRRLKILIYAVHAYGAAYGAETPETSCAGCAIGECCHNGAVGAPCGCCGELIPSALLADPDPQITAMLGMSAEHDRYLAEIRRLRRFAEDRELDHISYRPVEDGMRMITAGIPVEACLYAMIMHWEAADQQQAGIRRYDVASEFPGGVDAYIEALASARVLIFLHGPAGMGKSYWVKAFAARHGLDFASMPCTEGASPSWLLGKETMSGFKSTRFLQIWRGSGAFLFDEIDASDPNLLMVINDALANDLLFNPVDQDIYARARKCAVFAAANTLGTGADASYTARNQLDFSTLDRFRMGRVYVGYNAAVEAQIAAQNAAFEPIKF